MSDSQKIIDLESKIAFQEMAIEQLQQTVHDQFLMIEKLEKALQRLAERMSRGDLAGDIGPADEKPPHY